MPENNFLLVDLNETKTKKLAETITSDTSRKILNHLTEKDDTEANLAQKLALPISTVHYHLQKLQQTGLVVVEEFHYSKKGREVNHYKLANKYIIIAPRNVSGLKEKLKNILPVAGIALGLSAVLKIFFKSFASVSGKLEPFVAEQVAAPATESAVKDAVVEEILLEKSIEPTVPVIQQPDIAFWFFLGSMATIIIYILYQVVKEYKNR